MVGGNEEFACAVTLERGPNQHEHISATTRAVQHFPKSGQIIFDFLTSFFKTFLDELFQTRSMNSTFFVGFDIAYKWIYKLTTFIFNFMKEIF